MKVEEQFNTRNSLHSSWLEQVMALSGGTRLDWFISCRAIVFPCWIWGIGSYMRCIVHKGTPSNEQNMPYQRITLRITPELKRRSRSSQDKLADQG